MKNKFTHQQLTDSGGPETALETVNPLSRSIKWLIMTLLTFAVVPQVSAQITMSTGSTTTCSSMFYDSGGSSGSYSNNEYSTHTIYPSTTGAPVKVVFSSFNIESGWDYLYVYNGNSTSAPLIGSYTGTSGPGTVTSTASDGSLTFVFYSDVFVTSSGWEATVSCVTPCTGTPTAGTAVASTTTACPGVPVNFSLSGATSGTGLTYQWDTSSTGTAGTFVAITGATSATLSFTPPAGRTLYYRCRMVCTSSGGSATSTTVSVAVSTAPAPPYTETFEGTPAGTNVPCAAALSAFSSSTSYYSIDYWRLLDGADPTYGGGNHTPSGSKYMTAGYNTGGYYGYPAGYWFTPGIKLQAGKTYRFSYWYRVSGYFAMFSTTGAHFGMYYNTSQSASGATAIKPDLTNKNSSVYDQNVGDFTVPSDGTYYLGVKVDNQYYAYYGGGVIDDINLVELPACSTATSATFTTGGTANASPSVLCSTPGTTTLSVTGTPAFSGLTFEWQRDVTTAFSSPTTVGTTATVTNTISTGGVYYYRCKVTCPATGLSAFSSTVKVSTTPMPPPYIEDFEGANVPANVPCANYTYSWSSPGFYWSTANAGSPSSAVMNHTVGGSKTLLAGGYLGMVSGNTEWWFSPGLSLTAGKAYDVSFWFRNANSYSGYDSYDYTVGIGYGPSQSATAMSVLGDTTCQPSSTKSSWFQFKRGFVSSSTGTQYIGIRVNHSYYLYYGTCIDDIGVVQLPPCSAKPSAGTPKATPAMICSTGSTTLTLTGTSAASDLSFQWLQSSSPTGPWTTPTGGSGATTPSFTTATLTTGPVYYRCVVTCSLISAPNSDSSSVIRVNVGPITPPYIETFETATPGVNQPCASYTYGWDAGTGTSSYTYWGIKGAPGTSFSSVANHTPGGSKYLSAGYMISSYYIGSASDQQFWFSPPLLLTADMSYKCNYWYVTSGYSYLPSTTFGLYYGTSQSASAMIAMTPDKSGETNTTYKEIVGSFAAPTTGVYYLGVKVNNSYAYYGVAVDDIGVQELPLCAAKPTAGTVNASPSLICSTGTATLTLTGTSMASKLKFQWYESTAGPTGPWSAVSTGSGGTTAVYTTPTLSATRWYRCVVTCPLISAPNTDTTAVYTMNVGAIVPPYRENFEASSPGTNVPCAGASAWGASAYFYTTASTYTTGYTDLVNHTPGGSKFLIAGYGVTLYTGGRDYWFTPAIRLNAGSTYEFSYWYLPDNYPWSGMNFQTGISVGTSQSRAGMTTTLLADFTATNSTYQQASAMYTPTTTGNYYFGIYATGNYGYGMAIDDIGIDQLPPCSGKPSSGGISSVVPTMLCAPGSATFTLKSTPKVANLSYQWYECDAAGNLITSLGAASPSPTLTTTASTTKYYRCVVKCTLGSPTDTTYSNVIKLDVGAVTPPYIETFESGTPGVNMPCASYTYSFGASYMWNVQGSPVSSYSYGTLDNHTPGGSKYLIAGYYLHYYSGAPEMWFTPAIKFTSGKLYQLSYWYMTDGYAGCTYNLAAFMGNAQTKAAMTTPIGSSFAATNTSYKMFKQQFTAAATGNFYIGIQKSQSGWGYGLAIDDIGLQEVPPCSAPVVAGTIFAEPRHVCNPGGTTVLDLDGSTLATGLTYEWLSANSPAGPFLPTGGTGLPYTTDPLTAPTWFRAIVKCAATGATDTTPAFKVGVGGFDLPYKEDFETTSAGGVPLCSDATKWGSYWDGWSVYASTITGNYKNYTPGGKNYLIGGYYLGSPASTTEDNYWFTPGLNMRGGYKYNLSFYYVSTYTSSYKSKMGVYLGKAQAVSAMTTSLIKYRVFTNSSYEKADTMFVTPTSGVYYLGFRKSGSNPSSTYDYYGVAFDDINLNYAPCDGLPFAGNIKSSVSSGTAKCAGSPMTLIDTGATIPLVPGISYQWMRRPAGTSGSWSAVAGAKDTILSADTLIGYEYRLAVICGNTKDTAYSSPFSLPALPPHPPVSIAPATTPITYCLGDTVKFNATNFTGAVYDWMRDSVVVPGWKFSDMGATDPGVYMVKVTSALSPCPGWSNKVKLVANDPGYTVTITKPADSIICAGSSMVLTATASKPGVTFQWRKDNVNIPGATSSTYVVTTGGYYRVMASDGVSTCAAASRNIMITVKPNPPAIISIPGGTLTACENEGVRLDANTGGFSYEWTRGGSTVVGWTDSSQIIRASGTYAVKVRSSDGCVSVSTPVTVNILPSPVPVIVRTGDRLTTTLSYVSYQWFRNGVAIPAPAGQRSYLDITMKGVYKVEVAGTNNCTGESTPIEAMEDYLGVNNVASVTDQIRIYPNPTKSKVYIESPVKVRVKVKDVAGKTIYEEQITKEVDLSRFADGVYLFMVSDEQGNELIKQQRVTKVSAQ